MEKNTSVSLSYMLHDHKANLTLKWSSPMLKMEKCQIFIDELTMGWWTFQGFKVQGL